EEAERARRRPQAPLLVAGAEGLAEGGRAARAALAAARALGAPLELAPEGALCAGLELLEAGLIPQFAAHAARAREALLAARPIAPHLVFLDPAAARAVRERWPAHGA